VPETDTTTETPETATQEAAETTPTAGNGAATSDDFLIEVDGKLVPNYDATIHPFSEGDVVSGKVVRIDQDEVLVDIGYKSEGVIPSNELSIRKTVKPSEEVELGEEVDALVLTKEDQEGRLILSKKRARFEKAWRKIEKAADSGEAVPGTVIEVVKGGLILDLGVRGFLPASLVDIRRVQNLDEFMGQTLEAKVIELNRSRNNVVLSRRAVLEEERKEVREQILGRLESGQVVEGKISNIVDFGAFVDLEGIDGLIHISELSWSHVNHPSEVVSIGDTVRVKVLDIDKDRQRISLGLKQTQEDPWQQVLNEYKEGDVVDGKVTKIVAFGAFVQILPGVEGLVHISELAQHHVESPAEVVRPGDELKVKILEVDDSRRRLSLSVKRVEGQELPTREVTEDVVIEDAPEAEAEVAPPAAEESAAAEEELPAAEIAPEAPPEETVPDEAPSEESTEEPPAEESAAEEAPAEESPPTQD
jgi:small subunit ribosomal protein S1